MAKTVTKYTIFLSSPSDLNEERAALDEVIKELNLTFGNSNNCVLELLKWETHSAPGISHSHTQELITTDIGDDYDIFIGILWKRFGTPTQNAESGTEEEFLNALQRFQEGKNQPQILFYFKNSTPNSLSDIDPDQFLKVNKFKNSIPKDKMLFWDFNSLESLQNYFRMHIPRRIKSISNELKTVTTINEKEYDIDKSELGLLDYSAEYENLMTDSCNSLIKISQSTEWIGEEMVRKADELARVSKMSNTNRAIISNILIRTAKLMNDYSERLEVESPIFYSSFEEGIKAGINLINVTDDFNNDEIIEELQNSKESIIELRKAIPNALGGLKSFRDSIIELPRIQKEINIAKRKLTTQIDELIAMLNKTLDLATEFSDEVGSKIDKLKLLKQ